MVCILTIALDKLVIIWQLPVNPERLRSTHSFGFADFRLRVGLPRAPLSAEFWFSREEYPGW